MKHDVVEKVISLLPKDPALGITAQAIRDRFFERYPPEKAIQLESQTTRIRRYLEALTASGLVEVVPGTEPLRYHVNERKVRGFLAGSDTRLSLFWSQESISPLLPMLGTDSQSLFGKELQVEPTDRYLWQRVRIVPDGLGRRKTVIKDEHLKTVAEALRKGLMIDVTYGRELHEQHRTQLSVLGLAVKDGTIYAIVVDSMEGDPHHLPLHRIKSLELLSKSAVRRLDFDIDRYIEEQYQLSHKKSPRDPRQRLELLVHKDSLYHFIERPLIDQDEIDQTLVVDEVWYRVTAQVPDTVQLIPFLLSHGGWVQVLAPKPVRDEMAKRLRWAASHYEV